MPESLVQTLSRLEAELHQPAVRRNGACVRALLHPDFEEVGRSGRLYSREALVGALANEAEGSAAEVITADSYVATDLGQGIALLTYRSARKQEDGRLERHTLRSSIWVRVAGEWQLRYHQGTAAADVW
ncbi:DUF4440 domain-containing protein [Chromobacterium sp. ASV23]|uniref:nuclear transport factor 2 family protein n=1 Tax=Chromobacterium sp. ASV23 TaxID=2795110 RepID=UPI0018EB7F4A|nr:nuclear transport factor 2 family protein [Chromobacterium sp. ASV23]